MKRLHHKATLLLSRGALCCSLVVPFLAERAVAQELSSAARSHFAAARKAQDTDALDQAAEEYKATIRLAPTFAGAYSNLGLVLYVQGNFKASAAALTRGLHLDPKLVGANLYLGIDYLKLNHPDRGRGLSQAFRPARPFEQRRAKLAWHRVLAGRPDLGIS